MGTIIFVKSRAYVLLILLSLINILGKRTMTALGAHKNILIIDFEIILL
jgi:uncharacterized membrane protein YcaP (DUF421 family)